MQKENYEKFYTAGLIITILIMLGLSVAWINEPARMEELSKDVFKESTKRGRTEYIEQCAFCHGSNGQGGAGPALNSKDFLESTSDRILFETVSAGRPGTIMPSWAQGNGGPLTDEGIRDLVNFMRSWEENAPEVIVDKIVPDASRGLNLFNSSCFICHGENGVGGSIAPPINNPSRLNNLDNDWYRGVISYGRPSKGMPTWGTVLSPTQIEDLLALIDAWRSGDEVIPQVSVSEMLNSALFELSQGEVEDTIFYLDRAERFAFGEILVEFVVLRDLLDDDKVDVAFDLLVEISENWPVGNNENGATVFKDSCAACHGTEGEGGAGPRLNPNEYLSSNTNSNLLEFILTGRDGTAMSGFEDRLTVEQIADVITFLREWQP